LAISLLLILFKKIALGVRLFYVEITAGKGKEYFDLGPDTDLTRDSQPSTMGLYDTKAKRKAQTGASAYLFGGKEGLQDLS
jgi:hypothetical protein